MARTMESTRKATSRIQPMALLVPRILFTPPMKHRPEPIVEQAARRVALVPNRGELADVGIEGGELFGARRAVFAPAGSRAEQT